MRGKPTLLLQETFCQPKVQNFLDSVARNSTRSKDVYGFGLSHFQTFLHRKYGEGHTLETILEHIATNRSNVYTLLDNFVSYIITDKPQLSPNSISLYVAAVRSYLAYHDIDIVPSKFKRKVRLPKNHREDEEPLDASDIRRILLLCNNRRIKAYLLVLASGGMRTVEALAIRSRDIDFSVTPTRIHIRKEYAKTRVGRDVYISDEATKHLKEWINFKYRKRDSEEQTARASPDSLIFTRINSNTIMNLKGIYGKIVEEFHRLLDTIGMGELKEGSTYRRKITLHSFRRFVKTVIATQTNTDYYEYFLGHSKSPYWTMKEPERREIYATRVMKYLTFLDYSSLEVTGKNVEARLMEKEKEIGYLRERDVTNADAISELQSQVQILMSNMGLVDGSAKQKIAENLIRNKLYSSSPKN